MALHMGLARLLPRPNVRLASVPLPGETQVIALANQKGGVAKTTTTLNLGVAFAEQGYKVLLIDLDPQGNLTMSQGLNPDTIETSMFDVLVHRLPITQVIETVEVDIAVSSIDLAGADMALSSQIGRERALEKALAPIRDDYDFIMIDTPPSLGPADDQRVRRGDGCRRPGADRVPLAARSRAAREHARDGAREPQPEGRDHRDRPDDVRQARDAFARGRRDLCARASATSSTTHGFGRPCASQRRRSRERPSSPTSRPERRRRCTVTLRRRCSVARNRASMREGPLAELFRATEAAQRQVEGRAGRAAAAPDGAAGHSCARRRGAGSARADADPGGCPAPGARARAAGASARRRAGSTRFPNSRRASSARATARRTSRSSASSASAAPA